MRRFKKYLIGVWDEGHRVRWAKGAEFKADIATVFGYSIFFSLFLLLADALVIRLLQILKFK
ncbi:preprotein translocase subunit SecE [bacterium]|jgi:preprotein translocase SecE subunit|nr:preprotein translocase subunit SecE [bacterium]